MVSLVSLFSASRSHARARGAWRAVAFPLAAMVLSLAQASAFASQDEVSVLPDPVSCAAEARIRVEEIRPVCADLDARYRSMMSQDASVRSESEMVRARSRSLGCYAILGDYSSKAREAVSALPEGDRSKVALAEASLSVLAPSCAEKARACADFCGEDAGGPLPHLSAACAARCPQEPECQAFSVCEVPSSVYGAKGLDWRSDRGPEPKALPGPYGSKDAFEDPIAPSSR